MSCTTKASIRRREECNKTKKVNLEDPMRNVGENGRTIGRTIETGDRIAIGTGGKNKRTNDAVEYEDITLESPLADGKRTELKSGRELSPRLLLNYQVMFFLQGDL
jgi:hypothetical protein